MGFVELVDYPSGACLVSGFIWIPYTILLFYLFWEHHSRGKFPQNIIMLLLAIGATFRTIWFLLYTRYDGLLFMQILNRIAILLQFSALSVLILMWLRALQITQLAYEKQKHSEGFATSSNASLPSSHPNSSITTPNSHQNRKITINHPSRTSPGQPVSTKYISYQNIDERHRRLIWYIFYMNFLVWCALLLSLCGDNISRVYYNVNIILLVSLCLLESVFTLIVGLRMVSMLQASLTPVYLNNNNNNNHNNNTLDRNGLLHSSNHPSTATMNGHAGNGSQLLLLSAHHHQQQLLLEEEAAALAQHHHTSSTSSTTSSTIHNNSTACIAKLTVCWIRCKFFARKVFYRCLHLLFTIYASILFFYRLFFTQRMSNLYGLQLQRDILRTIISVTFIIFAFFLLRALGFTWRYLILPYATIYDDQDITDKSDGYVLMDHILYPLFFYQLPEMLPNIAIALGLSPPQGLLRRMVIMLNRLTNCQLRAAPTGQPQSAANTGSNRKPGAAAQQHQSRYQKRLAGGHSVAESSVNTAYHTTNSSAERAIIVQRGADGLPLPIEEGVIDNGNNAEDGNGGSKVLVTVRQPSMPTMQQQAADTAVEQKDNDYQQQLSDRQDLVNERRTSTIVSLNSKSSSWRQWLIACILDYLCCWCITDNNSAQPPQSDGHYHGHNRDNSLYDHSNRPTNHTQMTAGTGTGGGESINTVGTIHSHPLYHNVMNYTVPPTAIAGGAAADNSTANNSTRVSLAMQQADAGDQQVNPMLISEQLVGHEDEENNILSRSSDLYEMKHHPSNLTGGIEAAPAAIDIVVCSSLHQSTTTPSIAIPIAPPAAASSSASTVQSSSQVSSSVDSSSIQSPPAMVATSAGSSAGARSYLSSSLTTATTARSLPQTASSVAATSQPQTHVSQDWYQYLSQQRQTSDEFYAEFIYQLHAFPSSAGGGAGRAASMDYFSYNTSQAGRLPSSASSNHPQLPPPSSSSQQYGGQEGEFFAVPAAGAARLDSDDIMEAGGIASPDFKSSKIERGSDVGVTSNRPSLLTKLLG